MSFIISTITQQDAESVSKMLHHFWGGEPIVAYDMAFNPSNLPGLKAVMDGEIIGILHYQIGDAVCEIITLASLKEGLGVGSRLLEAVEKIAQDARCRKLCLTTTNDNLHALGFYQRRGFKLTALYPGKLDQSRKIKPTIPDIGEGGIPIRDELRLEKGLENN